MILNTGDVFLARRSRNVIAAGLLFAYAAGAAAADDKGGEGVAGEQPPPPAVVVAAIETKDVEKSGRFIGTIKAIQSVNLIARVEGFLEQVAFEQGHMVEQGELLYQIEQAPYQAAVDSAEGQVAAANSELDSAQANLVNKQGDFDRQAELLPKGDTSKAMYDQKKAERDEAKASVESAKASQMQAAAALETAKINLGYTTISSPIKGRIGATNYTVGNLVNSSSGTLSTVVQLDPIRAVFSIPSADFVRFQERVKQAGGDADAVKRQFVPALILPTGQPYGETGVISFADNQVDASTGTVAIYADFPNPDQMLLPGQFVTALLRSAQASRLPVVPAAAVQRTRDGEQVYVVGAGNRVEQRAIKTGTTVGTGYAVESGLMEGDIVIVSGVQKVKPGMIVKPVKASQASSSAGNDPSARTKAPSATESDKAPAPSDTDSGSVGAKDSAPAGTGAAGSGSSPKASSNADASGQGGTR
jgi:membrane fusion protein (multidrug efflux system)